MWRWLVGIFLILHGITHVFWPYYGPSTSWLIGDAPALAIALWVAATALFVIAGLALIVRSSLWRPLTVVSAIESIALMLLFWSIGLWVGLAINIAVLGVLTWMQRRVPRGRLATT
jgi:hypothetical protein